MSPEPGTPDEGTSSRARGLTAEEREARRRRLAEVFGEELPEQTSDDADESQRPSGGSDEWLRRQVPPHHG
jgi:hypothetical protein